jgi:hypothetical protein
MDRKTRPVALAVAALALLLTAGCVEIPIEDVPAWLRPTDPGETETIESVDEDSEEAWSDGRDEHGREMPYGTHGHGTEILMLGRSVMGDWFDHWGWDGEHAVTREGYALYYGELASPPDIADTAIAYVQRVPDTTVIFFKLCFVDFQAGSPADIDASLAETVGYVEQVIEAARARGLTLIVGTALPQTASNTTVDLAELHARYNSAIRELASAHDQTYVFDLHDSLSNPSGVLYKGFAVMPGDAHLTDTAYFELDERFFEFLETELSSLQ